MGDPNGDQQGGALICNLDEEVREHLIVLFLPGDIVLELLTSCWMPPNLHDGRLCWRISEGLLLVVEKEVVARRVFGRKFEPAARHLRKPHEMEEALALFHLIGDTSIADLHALRIGYISQLQAILLGFTTSETLSGRLQIHLTASGPPSRQPCPSSISPTSARISKMPHWPS